jgi:hypothetical protein
MFSSTICCLLGQCRDVQQHCLLGHCPDVQQHCMLSAGAVSWSAAPYAVCWGSVMMLRTLTFNLHLIPLFWPFVTCLEKLIWDHMVRKSASLHPPTHTTVQATLRPAKPSFIKEDSMLSCHTCVLYGRRLYFNNLYIMPPNSVTVY